MTDIVDYQAPPDLHDSPLYNDDLAPTTAARRTWSVWAIAALWISMSACIPTYTLASGLVDQGMNWWQAVLTIFAGNAVVLVPMVLNGYAGTKYGIPFPVYCRASFGTKGANLPAMLRAVIACGWFGIQSWIGGAAVLAIAVAYKPEWGDHVLYPRTLGVSLPEFIALNKPSTIPRGQFWTVFFPKLTGVVGFWATLSLNIPDFTRYAKSQRDQAVGQALGLPMTMALYSFIGVAVTTATGIGDPIKLVGTFTNKWVLVPSLSAIVLATLATNIAANVVSPANDFSNLAPRYIGFRLGGFLTGLIGIVIMPWQLIANAHVYIDTWLIGSSSLLGAVGGVLICDYWVLRRARLDVAGLYQPDGPFRYERGVNWCGVLAVVVAVLPCVPGFVDQLTDGQLLKSDTTIAAVVRDIYLYAWFFTFFVSGVVYAVLMTGYPNLRGSQVLPPTASAAL